MPLVVEADDLTPVRSPNSRESKVKRIYHRLYKKHHSRCHLYSLPDPWQCKVHLKLTRVFARLNESVIDGSIANDATFDPGQYLRTQTGLDGLELQQELWRRYVCRAAQRFAKWWSIKVPKDEDGNLQQVDMSVLMESGGLETLLLSTKPWEWTEQNLPPIDVLMVFYTFMLHPRCFLEDCVRFNRLSLWKAGIPWKLLDITIDPVTFDYNVSPSARKTWTSETRIPWDNDLWYQDLPDEAQKRISKFHRALRGLRTKGYPMRGTILDSNGIARSATQSGSDPPMFEINKLLLGELGQRLLEKTIWDNVRQRKSPSMDEIQAEIKNYQGSLSQHLTNRALDVTMSQFRSTHSIFSLELAAAVQQHFNFIIRMEDVDWLRSPVHDFTIEILIQRYTAVFQSLGENRLHSTLPTNTIDLAWRTHQLSPSSYYCFSIANIGNVFVGHDDTVEDDTLTNSLNQTRHQPSSPTTSVEDTHCLCWQCATVLKQVDSKTDNLGYDKHGHIILNSGTPIHNKVMKKIAKTQSANFEEDFAFACHRAEKMGNSPPDRGSFLKTYVWPYPQAVPKINT